MEDPIPVLSVVRNEGNDGWGGAPPLAPWFLSEVVPRKIREGFLSLLLRSGTDLMPRGVMSLHFSGGIFTKLMCPQDMLGKISEYFNEHVRKCLPVNEKSN
jgi:hypothetical protein